VKRKNEVVFLGIRDKIFFAKEVTYFAGLARQSGSDTLLLFGCVVEAG